MGFLAILQAGALIIGSLITIAGFVHDRRREKENQVFSNPTIMFVGCIAVGLIAANFLLSKKSTSPTGPTGPTLSTGVSTFVTPGPAQVQQPFSIRQQQADEAAAAIAGAFLKADQEAWLDEQIERAKAYFAKQSPTSKP